MAKVEEQYPIDLGLTSNNKFIIVNKMHILILGVLRWLLIYLECLE